MIQDHDQTEEVSAIHAQINLPDYPKRSDPCYFARLELESQVICESMGPGVALDWLKSAEPSRNPGDSIVPEGQQ